MLLGLYSLATRVGAPFVRHHLARRARRGKEDAARIGERYGRPSLDRPGGPLLWVHAASVGESLAALPLIRLLLDRYPTLAILVTTGTVTSARLMAERLPERAFHQFAPLDLVSARRAFLDHWRPDLGCLIESEVWPNLMLEAGRRHLPLVLINGRMSEKSGARWRYAGRDALRLFQGFTLCLARSQADAERFAALGVPDVRTLGDLKNGSPPLPADPEALSALETAIDGRPLFLAASTHPGEERLLSETHRLMRERHPTLLTIIVPRHPERGERIAEELREGGMVVRRRSQGELPDRETVIYLADTLGELGLFYRLVRLVFIGGSLVPHGGQNPLEAARLGCPPLFGPHTGNFNDMTAALLAKGAARRVRDERELAGVAGDLLCDPGTLDEMAVRARAAGVAEEAVLARIADALAPLIDPPTGRPGPAAGASETFAETVPGTIDACA